MVRRNHILLQVHVFVVLLMYIHGLASALATSCCKCNAICNAGCRQWQICLGLPCYALCLHLKGIVHALVCSDATRYLPTYIHTCILLFQIYGCGVLFLFRITRPCMCSMHPCHACRVVDDITCLMYRYVCWEVHVSLVVKTRSGGSYVFSLLDATCLTAAWRIQEEDE